MDIGNLVSLRYRLPVAVLDTRRLQGAITVHFADGSETFTDLNSKQPEHPAAGEWFSATTAKPSTPAAGAGATAPRANGKG
ncbi:MAG: hypothetical protein HXY40_13605 [Chloroflexi bacterium]|nr:hypothetical protein [Chloroflexota bacterium]